MLLSPSRSFTETRDTMKVLAVHPSALMYTKIYLRLEPLGLELVAQAIRQAGHEVRLIDLQVESHRDYFKLLQNWQPDVVAFSCNYLANVPEIVDLAKLTKDTLPQSFVFVGGHSASFIAEQFLNHGGGAIDCILKGEGERLFLNSCWPLGMTEQRSYKFPVWCRLSVRDRRRAL